MRLSATKYRVMRIYSRKRAEELAARMNETVQTVPGGHPNRVYFAERGRFMWSVMKDIDGNLPSREPQDP